MENFTRGSDNASAKEEQILPSRKSLSLNLSVQVAKALQADRCKAKQKSTHTRNLTNIKQYIQYPID